MSENVELITPNGDHGHPDRGGILPLPEGGGRGVGDASFLTGVARGGRAALFIPVALCAAWAFWPLGSSDAVVPGAAAVESREPLPPRDSPRAVAMDLSAYRAPIWVAPPPPPPAPKPAPAPPPPPPLKLQLLAIIDEPTGRAAVCYDPDADRIVTIRDGEKSTSTAGWGGRKGVARVTTTSLTIGEGSLASTLTLAPGGAGIRGASR
ncbi:MAG: hypothetical protein ACKVS8_11205 [Phycisphaerales bacterium]